MARIMVDTLKAIRYGMGNPLSRAILKTGFKGSTHGRSRLDAALEAFAFGTVPGNLTDRMYTRLLRIVFDTICMIFSVKGEDLAKYLQEPVTRRGVSSVLKGIATYGVTKPQLLNAPFLVVWNLTNMCNLRCRHCYQQAGHVLKDELSLEEKFKVVDELTSAGVVAIAFSGGEPIMHPDFFPTARRARERGLYVSVATNGVLLTPEMMNRLKDVGVGYIEVSLDSARPEVHDGFRGVPGAWKRTVEGIAHSAKAGVFTVMATTVTRLNYENVSALIDLSKKLGVNRFTHFNFIPTGRGKEITSLDLSPQQREDLLRLLFEKSQTSGIEVLSTAPQFARVVFQQSRGGAIAPTHFYVGQNRNWGLKALAEFIGGCGAARLYCAIQPNGDVTPCVFIPQLIVGNIREKSFSEIWHTTKIFKEFQVRTTLKGSCKTCDYNKICGGCKARSLGYFQDYNAPDVGCINNLESWNKIAPPEELLHVKAR
jgi:radical SAM protein with 4Fe4S-binding SPASM domain